MERDVENNYINILGYEIYSQKKNDCIKEILGRKKVHVVSGNPEILYRGLDNKKLFNNFTAESSIIIPDGVGTQIAAKLCKTPVEEKIAGIEVMKAIIEECEKEGKGIYLLGASEECINGCVKNLKRDHPNLIISGYHNGFFDIDNPGEILADIKEKKPKALFVAMGCPRQENFIIDYMEELPVEIFMGVGGSFDIIAEKLNRAPQWMINIGLEWAYRVLKEPWRIKRLGNIPKFIFIAWKNRGLNHEKR